MVLQVERLLPFQPEADLRQRKPDRRFRAGCTLFVAPERRFAVAPGAALGYFPFMEFGATVSDLHLFSHHSRPGRYLERIRDTARASRVLVLNGDIFDFKWSEHGVFSRSVMAAERFLEDLLAGAPECRIRVVLGNHDAVPPYMESLEALSGRHANLDWNEFACVEGDRVFLHGDVIHAGATNEAVRRFRAKLQRPASGHPWQRFAHGAVHRSHVPRVALRMVPKRMLASRILAYLQHEQWLNGDPVRHIHFGHTHNDFEDFRYRGFLFHNCGSATHGARLRVVRFPLQQGGP
jgi:UDP-2,3-diacylglucosamine hydrolase